MQIINNMVQCSQCGCIAFPDAMYCPKCGMSYRNDKTKSKAFEKIGFSSKAAQDEAQKLLEEAWYEFSYPRQHQVVDTKTIVIMPRIKCPLCQES